MVSLQFTKAQRNRFLKGRRSYANIGKYEKDSKRQSEGLVAAVCGTEVTSAPVGVIIGAINTAANIGITS